MSLPKRVRCLKDRTVQKGGSQIAGCDRLPPLPTALLPAADVADSAPVRVSERLLLDAAAVSCCLSVSFARFVCLLLSVLFFLPSLLLFFIRPFCLSASLRSFSLRFVCLCIR